MFIPVTQWFSPGGNFCLPGALGNIQRLHFSGCARWHVGSWFSDQGSLQWKCRVLPLGCQGISNISLVRLWIPKTDFFQLNCLSLIFQLVLKLATHFLLHIFYVIFLAVTLSGDCNLYVKFATNLFELIPAQLQQPIQFCHFAICFLNAVYCFHSSFPSILSSFVSGDFLEVKCLNSFWVFPILFSLWLPWGLIKYPKVVTL